MERFTLEEFATDLLAWPSEDANGQVMVFATFEAAAEMAEWMLEGGAEDGQLPLVGILAHEHPSPVLGDIPADADSRCAGWVEYADGKVSRHEGDYEDEPRLWAARMIAERLSAGESA